MSSGSRTAPSERSHYVSTLSSILPPPLTLPPRTNSSSSSGPGGAARARRGANVVCFSDGSRPEPRRTESGVAGLAMGLA